MNAENILEMHGVTKQFPGVKALDAVDLTVRKGEVHAIIGENGAGKSTLMKILSGVYIADSGEIIIDGKPAKITNPRDAEKLGVSIVYQELSNFPLMTIAENICAGVHPRKHGLVDYKRIRESAQQYIEEFELTDLKPNQTVQELSVGRQQVVEIIKAISRESKILILDEPTSALTEKETELLFDIIHRLQARGTSVIYISHRLDEIFRICNRVTVFRDGKYIKTLDVQNTTKDEMVSLMVGRSVAYNYGAHTSKVGDVALEVRNLSYSNIVKNVSFQAHKGEVLGIAGLEGSGRTELVECVFGARRRSAGEILINGKSVNIKNPTMAKKNKLAYITKDRKRVGLFMRSSISANIMAANLGKFSKHALINFKKAEENSEFYWKKFQIKSPTLAKQVIALSGGNQQKVLLAMWFTTEPDILIVDEPTRGIDVGTKEEIHKLIRELAQKGVAVVIISSDLPELLGASDRIMVMYEGEVTGVLENRDLTEEQIIKLASNATIS